jgi:hypothetical protein
MERLAMSDGAEKRYIRVKYTDTLAAQQYIKQSNPGIDIAPRAVENALRRGQLKFYQVGRKRYTTAKLIDEWLESLITTAK